MTMNIMFCGDEKMTDGVLIATLSLMRHTDQPLHLCVNRQAKRQWPCLPAILCGDG